MEAKKRSPLGDIIKNARQKNGLTIEELAEKADIMVRYLYRIENQDAKPSYELLYFLIRELAIENIFLPPVHIYIFNLRIGIGSRFPTRS